MWAFSGRVTGGAVMIWPTTSTKPEVLGFGRGDRRSAGQQALQACGEASNFFDARMFDEVFGGDDTDDVASAADHRQRFHAAVPENRPGFVEIGSEFHGHQVFRHQPAAGGLSEFPAIGMECRGIVNPLKIRFRDVGVAVHVDQGLVQILRCDSQALHGLGIFPFDGLFRFGANRITAAFPGVIQQQGQQQHAEDVQGHRRENETKSQFLESRPAECRYQGRGPSRRMQAVRAVHDENSQADGDGAR